MALRDKLMAIDPQDFEAGYFNRLQRLGDVAAAWQEGLSRDRLYRGLSGFMFRIVFDTYDYSGNEELRPDDPFYVMPTAYMVGINAAVLALRECAEREASGELQQELASLKEDRLLYLVEEIEELEAGRDILDPDDILQPYPALHNFVDGLARHKPTTEFIEVDLAHGGFVGEAAIEREERLVRGIVWGTRRTFQTVVAHDDPSVLVKPLNGFLILPVRRPGGESSRP